MVFSFSSLAAVLPLLATLAVGQQIGTAIPEVHPKLPTQLCTKAGGCVTKMTSLVTDALSRPFHKQGDMSASCSTVTAATCPDAATCAKSCVLEGITYGSIGVLTAGTALTLRQYLPNGSGFSKVSPRVYLLADDDKNYELLQLTNKELTFDVDLSSLACGMNGALYLSEMDGSGSRTADLNPAGAAYGTGYCDAQCFNVSWINGLVSLPRHLYLPLHVLAHQG